MSDRKFKAHNPLEIIPKPRDGITKLIWDKFRDNNAIRSWTGRFLEEQTVRSVIYATVGGTKEFHANTGSIDEVAVKNMPQGANAYFALVYNSSYRIQYVRIV